MRAFFRFLVFLLVLAILVGGGAWFWAGRSAGPTITIRQPGKFVGQNSSLELVAEAPEGKFTSIDVTVEQSGKTLPVFTLDQPQGNIRQESAERLYVMRPVGKRALPDLQSGPARIVVKASRPVLFGLRNVSSTTTHDVTVRLEPPQVSVLSTFHYVNHGGSEFVVYRATPADVESGVRVGNVEYAGFPATAVGITSDPALRVAFFALLFDQDLNTDFNVFARDPAGNEALAALDHQVFPKPYSKSRIEIDDRFIGRVVPAIASNSPQEKIPTDDLLSGFLKINGDLRQKNNQYLMELAKKSEPKMLFKGPFQQLGNSQVEARFADTRTYVYKGKEVDRQVHLGFDLAVTANVPDRLRGGRDGRPCLRPGHLRKLRCHRPRPRRAVAVWAPVVDWRESRRSRGKRQRTRSQRDDRPRRRGSPAFHDARRRTAGHAGRLVEQTVVRGPGSPQDRGSRWRVIIEGCGTHPS